jgi:hypothetical protein
MPPPLQSSTPTARPRPIRPRRMWAASTALSTKGTLFCVEHPRSQADIPVLVLDLSPASVAALRESVAKSLLASSRNMAPSYPTWEHLNDKQRQSMMSHADAALAAIGVRGR